MRVEGGIGPQGPIVVGHLWSSELEVVGSLWGRPGEWALLGSQGLLSSGCPQRPGTGGLQLEL